jgi:hypothetical protein
MRPVEAASVPEEVDAVSTGNGPEGMYDLLLEFQRLQLANNQQQSQLDRLATRLDRAELAAWAELAFDGEERFPLQPRSPGPAKPRAITARSQRRARQVATSAAAATKMQAWWRGTRARDEILERLADEIYAAEVIQERWRCWQRPPELPAGPLGLEGHDLQPGSDLAGSQNDAAGSPRPQELDLPVGEWLEPLGLGGSAVVLEERGYRTMSEVVSARLGKADLLRLGVGRKADRRVLAEACVLGAEILFLPPPEQESPESESEASVGSEPDSPLWRGKAPAPAGLPDCLCKLQEWLGSTLEFRAVLVMIQQRLAGFDDRHQVSAYHVDLQAEAEMGFNQMMDRLRAEFPEAKPEELEDSLDAAGVDDVEKVRVYMRQQHPEVLSELTALRAGRELQFLSFHEVDVATRRAIKMAQAAGAEKYNARMAAKGPGDGLAAFEYEKTRFDRASAQVQNALEELCGLSRQIVGKKLARVLLFKGSAAGVTWPAGPVARFVAGQAAVAQALGMASDIQRRYETVRPVAVTADLEGESAEICLLSRRSVVECVGSHVADNGHLRLRLQLDIDKVDPRTLRAYTAGWASECASSGEPLMLPVLDTDNNDDHAAADAADAADGGNDNDAASDISAALDAGACLSLGATGPGGPDERARGAAGRARAMGALRALGALTGPSDLRGGVADAENAWGSSDREGSVEAAVRGDVEQLHAAQTEAPEIPRAWLVEIPPRPAGPAQRPRPGRRHPILAERTVVGRTPRQGAGSLGCADVCLGPDNSISRRHAELLVHETEGADAPPECTLRLLGTSAVRINGDIFRPSAVPSADAAWPLRPGDRVQLGRTTVVRLELPPRASPAEVQPPSTSPVGRSASSTSDSASSTGSDVTAAPAWPPAGVASMVAQVQAHLGAATSLAM